MMTQPNSLILFALILLMISVLFLVFVAFYKRKTSIIPISQPELIKSILDNALVCIFVKDKNHKYLLVNRYACSLFHAREADILGKTDAAFFSPQYASTSFANEKEILKIGHTIREELEITLPEGKRFFSIIKAPLQDSQGNIFGICGIATDITPQKNTQQKLSDYLEKLESVTTELMDARIVAEKASKAKNTFLANISHELRTPLHTVLGSATLLMHTHLDEKQKVHVQRIESSAHLLIGIIGNVLDLSKIASGELKIESLPSDISQIVTDCFNVLSLEAEEKHLEYTIHLPKESLPILLTDPLRLKQVLINLLSNAIKFTKKGFVRLYLNIMSQTSEKMELRFIVEDSGIGIPEEKRKHMFERFWQADVSTTRKYGGTGLGLAISRELVKLMGGTIFCKSEVEIGSSFFVTLPFFLDHKK